MPKTITPLLLNRIQLESTTLVTLWEITRVDGIRVLLTDHDQNLTIEDDTYIAMVGYNRTALTIREGLDSDTMDITGILSVDTVSEDDIIRGLYDFADLRISLIDHSDPSLGIAPLKRGKFGEVITTPSGLFRTEVSSLTAQLSQEILERAAPLCRADLGDVRCMVPLNPVELQREQAVTEGQFFRVVTGAGPNSDRFENRIYEVTQSGITSDTAPTFSSTVGDTTLDGNAEFTARESFTRSGVVVNSINNQELELNIDEPRAFTDGEIGDNWFAQGLITFETGVNSGRTFEIRTWLPATNTIVLIFELIDDAAIGDVFVIEPGDDKRRTTCRNKFVIPDTRDFANGNVINMQAEPDLPGRDALLTVPDAQ